MSFARAFGLLALTVGSGITGCAAVTTEDAVGAGSSELEGSDTPRPTTRPRGIDVSHHNGSVNWTRVKGTGGQTFAFARISDGLTQPDSTFAAHWREMKSAGLVRGAYQFFRARRDGVAQADLLLQMVADAGGYHAGDLPPVLDIETADGQPISLVRSRCHAWIARIEQKLGVRPIVYTGNHMTEIIGTEFKDYPLWIAHYGVTSPRIPAGWTTWHLWQNSESGTVAGVTGRVDTNFFNGTNAGLLELTIPQALPPAPTEPTEPTKPPPEPEPEPSEPDPDAPSDVPDDAAMGDGIRAHGG